MPLTNPKYSVAPSTFSLLLKEQLTRTQDPEEAAMRYDYWQIPLKQTKTQQSNKGDTLYIVE